MAFLWHASASSCRTAQQRKSLHCDSPGQSWFDDSQVWWLQHGNFSTGVDNNNVLPTPFPGLLGAALQSQAWKVSFYVDIPVSLLLNKTILITVEVGIAEKMFDLRESSGVLGKIYLTERADNV